MSMLSDLWLKYSHKFTLLSSLQPFPKGKKTPKQQQKTNLARPKLKLKAFWLLWKQKLQQPHTSSSTQACHFGTPPSEPALNTWWGGWCRITPGTRPLSNIPLPAPHATANWLLLRLTEGFLFFSHSFLLTPRSSQLDLFCCICNSTSGFKVNSSFFLHTSLCLSAI